ncbi:TetR/AcrR family transcriptional regulator [Bombilactobacillus thymidiniphilus]|uniref:TetR/AcrR family transcriptional regulator n=1 Tax=Bombilactobacillus thymidiniphilus TaxID=2923363 RepID=A0ABY4PBH7_9LACO|nr:TetR/AcrR family transcriptional regulator [Bombilactobacillus thymidiniphilus]UQS83027.1 TetR/AcrR family transcriptional regulator [Bombilactobacillus thymidiniphilus]
MTREVSFISNQRINKEQIIRTAQQLIFDNGVQALTFPRLASELNIRSQSLYNYFRNASDLIGHLGTIFMQDLYKLVMEGLIGLSGRAAFKRYAEVAHEYLENQGRLVELIYYVHDFPIDSAFYQATAQVIDLLHKLVASTKLKHMGNDSYAQTLISAVLGFTLIEMMGFLPTDQKLRQHQFTQLLDFQLSEIDESTN